MIVNFCLFIQQSYVSSSLLLLLNKLCRYVMLKIIPKISPYFPWLWQVTKVMARMASADIMCVGSKSVKEKFSGIIRFVIINLKFSFSYKVLMHSLSWYWVFKLHISLIIVVFNSLGLLTVSMSIPYRGLYSFGSI